MGLVLGADEGKEVGTFVGAPGRYVGDKVGLTEGTTLGTAEGRGVGTPAT